MIWVVWMTQKWEDDVFIAAFDNEAAANEFADKLKNPEKESLDAYRLKRGYIDYVVSEEELYHEARDARVK